MVGIWDELSVEASTITTFRRHLDKYIDRKDFVGYGPNMEKWD